MSVVAWMVFGLLCNQSRPLTLVFTTPPHLSIPHSVTLLYHFLSFFQDDSVETSEYIACDAGIHEGDIEEVQVGAIMFLRFCQALPHCFCYQNSLALTYSFVHFLTLPGGGVLPITHSLFSFLLPFLTLPYQVEVCADLQTVIRIQLLQHAWNSEFDCARGECVFFHAPTFAGATADKPAATGHVVS
jgi:hypothetical protein